MVLKINLSNLETDNLPALERLLRADFLIEEADAVSQYHEKRVIKETPRRDESLNDTYQDFYYQ